MSCVNLYHSVRPILTDFTSAVIIALVSGICSSLHSVPVRSKSQILSAPMCSRCTVMLAIKRNEPGGWCWRNRWLKRVVHHRAFLRLFVK